MKKRGLVLWVLAAVLSGGIFSFWHHRDPLIERGLEKWLNHVQRPFFAGTLVLRGFHLDQRLKVLIDEVRGDWQTHTGFLPVEVHEIRFLDPFSNFIFRQPVSITFERFRPAGSKSPGVRGWAVLHQDKAGTFELHADFAGLELEELTVLDPESLKGATGGMTGKLYLKTTETGTGQEFRLNLKVEEPGGRLQSRFFEIFQPYLPAAQKRVLQALTGLDTVTYRKADFEAVLAGPGDMKIFLNILVPDYNLNLNLNLTLRVEDEEAFLKLAQLLGLVRIEVT